MMYNVETGNNEEVLFWHV